MTDQLTVHKASSLEETYSRARVEAGELEPREPFSKILSESHESLRLLAQRVDKHSAFIRDHYEARLNRLCNNYLDPLTITYHISLTWEYGTSFSLGVSCDSLREVIPLLRVLAAEGLQIIDRPERDSQSSTKSWILYPRDLDRGKGPSLNLHITAKTCEQVQVGTREVPVYETRCDWGEVAEPTMLEGEVL